MSPTLIEILKILATILLAIGGLEGTKAVITKIRASRTTQNIELDDYMPRAECSLVHSNTAYTISNIKQDVSDIKTALQTLVRIEERLMALDQAIADKIEIRVSRALARHISEYHSTHVSGKMEQFDSDQIK